MKWDAGHAGDKSIRKTQKDGRRSNTAEAIVVLKPYCVNYVLCTAHLIP